MTAHTTSPQNLLWITFSVRIREGAARPGCVAQGELVQIMADYIGYGSLKLLLPGAAAVLDARAGK